ncbi:MAG: TolC family protein [Alphaproteobacteria bacterium]|nr:TolC family protein [Alphaproteobacteria bacterium]
MKKTLFLLVLSLFSLSARAEFDPLSVYSLEPPENCIEADLNGPLSLSDLVQIGICTNPALNRDYMSVRSTEAGLGQARSQYLPTITAEGEAGIQNTKIEGQSHKQDEPYSANLAISWLLFDFGGRSARVNTTKAYLESESWTYNANLQQTVLSIHQAYLNLLGNKELLKSTEVSEKSFKKAFDEAKRKYDLGMVSLSDKLQAQTSYEQASLAVISARNAVKQSQGDLAALLNLSPDVELQLQDQFSEKDLTDLAITDNVSELMLLALEQRPEIKAAEGGVRGAKENVWAAKTEMMPSVAAVGNVSFNDGWKNDTLYHRGSGIGLKASMPLFTGFSNTYKVAEAKYQYEQARYSVEDIQINVRNQVWKAYQDYLTAKEAYQKSLQILKSAEENERVAFKSYKVGKKDMLNLLTANAGLASAMQGKVQAFYNVLISKAVLYRAVGQF